MSRETDLYRQISASDAEHFHTCFYCGCIATQYDSVPPLKYAQFYLRTREEADFYKVPSCRECFYLLKNDKSALLGQRVDAAKRLLAGKYKRAIRIYEVWNPEEIDELDYHLKRSVDAGMVLGEESCQRVAYTGFDYEADGLKHHAHFVQNEVFQVFGEKFGNFRDALEHGHKAYRIPKAKLIELYTEHKQCFDAAINVFHEQQTRKVIDKKLKSQCTDFALKHKQNTKFVMRTVEMYCEQDESLTIEMALDKLYQVIIRV